MPPGDDEATLPLAKEPMPLALAAGTVVAEYVIERLLAEGGQGAVHVAVHRVTDQRVAIKVLRGELLQSTRAVERFLREFDFIRQIRHPAVVACHESGTLSDGRPFYVMEHLQGETLRALVHRRGRLAEGEVLEILSPVCEALAVAHAAGIVHRDVKMSNIFLTAGPGGRGVKLLDFGVAKLLDQESGGGSSLTTAGSVVGSLTILAPEQIRGEPLDARTDVYALGVVLYATAVGALPFPVSNTRTMLMAHLHLPPPRPSASAPLSPGFDAVVLRCLEKQPDRRFASVMDVLSALRGTAPARVRHEVPAVGLYVGFHLPPDEADEELEVELALALDSAESLLRAAGFLVSVSPEHLLAVRVLTEAVEERAAIEAALTLAQAVEEDLRRRPAARIRGSTAVHVAPVSLGGPTGEIFEGPLARVGDWAPSPGNPREDA